VIRTVAPPAPQNSWKACVGHEPPSPSISFPASLVGAAEELPDHDRIEIILHDVAHRARLLRRQRLAGFMVGALSGALRAEETSPRLRQRWGRGSNERSVQWECHRSQVSTPWSTRGKSSS
jgi:hypothetical protein